MPDVCVRRLLVYLNGPIAEVSGRAFFASIENQGARKQPDLMQSI